MGTFLSPESEESLNARPFHDPSNPPTEQAVQAALGDVYLLYRKLLDLTHPCSQAWGFTPSSGWSLKVHDKKKALFYLFPLYGNFKISLTVREGERDAFLGDAELSELHDRLASSKKYSEGFALQFEIAGEETYVLPALFISKIKAMRV
ncbi:MAG: DUF3788 family protein [Chloroflexota bacterium]